MASISLSPSSSDAPARSDPSNDPKIGEVQEPIEAASEISLVIDSIKQRVDADRCVYIMKKVEENRQKLGDITSSLQKLSIERKNLINSDADKIVDMLTKRQKDAIYMQNGINTSNGDDDSSSSHEDGNGSSAILLGSSIAVKNAVRPIKLPEIQKLPPYTTWIFLDRNQRMTEDQSVLGRRRIYYDQNGGEALIASDSEEEVMDEEEEKKVFIESEDNILRMTIEELGLSDVVLDVLAQRLSRKPNELKARYEVLVKRENDVGGSTSRDIDVNPNLLLDKDLDTALDSFDNLFCRRCLVFDCKLHGCSQDLIFPAEKPLPWNCRNEENVPCGPHCYHLVLMSENNALTSPMGVNNEGIVALTIESNGVMPKKKSAGPSLRRRLKSCQSETASSNAKSVHESSDSETRVTDDMTDMTHSQSPRKSKLVDKCGTRQRNSKRIAEHVLLAVKKRQKKGGASDSDSLASGSLGSRDMNLRSSSRKENEDATSSSHKVKSSYAKRSRKRSPVPSGDESIDGEAPNFSSKEIIITGQPVSSCDETSKKEEFVGENICKEEVRDFKYWKALEKSLFEKGVEIFGRNRMETHSIEANNYQKDVIQVHRYGLKNDITLIDEVETVVGTLSDCCLIARNLMNGMKTCAEVFYAMNAENKLSSLRGNGTNSLIDGVSKGDGNEVMGSELRRRSRFLRRRGKVRRLKYTWKSTGYNSMKKRISDKKDMPCRQYNPCGCKSACGKDCSCSVSGTCCEKYCGCPKTCKNRFRGCHCAKSQCRSRQCPCFAAGRECDPDVCRNCWISCGDGTLGIPFQRGDNYECRNMKLLLKQQQRVLLGRSDISGWGAFLKKSVAKHEYLGEYTGELISHREADKRGKIYDRENSSFLFNLNDQYVLDAYRKGDKLKFANHSPDPNCYAKVIMVAGDHRVGIFAKERICAGEELFYDYRYEPDRAPVWARKPEASGSKKEDTAAPSTGRAKKLA